MCAILSEIHNHTKGSLLMSPRPEKILITPSPYVTLLYLLMNDLHSIENTAYFFVSYRNLTDKEKSRIRSIVPESYFLREPKLTIRFRNNESLQRIYTALQIAAKRIIPYAWLRMTKKLRWPFLKDSEIWCYDNYSSAKAIIGRRKYVFLEEGLFTYENADLYAGGASFLRRLQIFLDAPFGVRGLGTTPQAERVILTGLAEIPECYRQRGFELVSMPALWEKSDNAKRAFIMKFFELSESDAQELRRRDIIFVDQPLADDGLITKSEQVELVRKILDHYGDSRVLIKTHYRNTINYREIFPGAMIWDKQTPMELLGLCGVNFSMAVTVNSTAALSFPESVKLEWLGGNMGSEYFSHFSPESQRVFADFAARFPIPERVRFEENKKENQQ